MQGAPGSIFGSGPDSWVHRRGRHGRGYRARDVRLGRDVALKLLPGDVRQRCGALAAIRAGSAGDRGAQPPEHHSLSTTSAPTTGSRLSCQSCSRANPFVRCSPRPASGPNRRRVCAADRSWTDGRPSPGYRPSGSEAGKPLRHATRLRQDSGLRPCQADGAAVR